MTATTDDLRRSLAMAGLLLLGQGKDHSLFALHIAMQLGYSNYPVVAEELAPFLRKIAGLGLLTEMPSVRT